MANFELDPELASMPKNSLIQRWRDKLWLRRTQFKEEDVQDLNRDCMKLYQALQACVEAYSWNDNYCVDEVRERYTYCIVRRVGEEQDQDKMRLML